MICLIAALACSSAPEPRATPRPSRRADLITAEEIAQRNWSDAYELIIALRRNWLHSRGEDTITGDRTAVQVHVDGARVGRGEEALRATSLLNVTSIQFIDGISASARWGLGYDKGAILISTQRR